MISGQNPLVMVSAAEFWGRLGMLVELEMQGYTFFGVYVQRPACDRRLPYTTTIFRHFDHDVKFNKPIYLYILGYKTSDTFLLLSNDALIERRKRGLTP